MMAGMFAGRQQPRSDLIDQFRELVKERLGDLALAILDERLSVKTQKSRWKSRSWHAICVLCKEASSGDKKIG